MAMETTALAIVNEYPPERFNTLIPVKSIQEIDPLHRVIVNEVKIESNIDKKDVYKEKNGEYALTKKALAKLMAGANVQIVDSRSVQPKKCERCIEVAKATRLAPKCFECPHFGDIAHQVTIAVPQPDGSFRMVKGTKEIRMDDTKASMTDAQFKQFRPFAAEQCETKALNRALREGLMVQNTYKQADLEKPFVVAMVVPNYSDPELKAAMIRRYENSEGALFGSTPKQLGAGSEPLQALPGGRTVDTTTGEITEVDDDDDTPPSLGDTPAFDEPAAPAFDPPKEVPTCQDCGEPVKLWIDRNQKEWSVDDTVAFTQANLKGVFCHNCAGARMREIAKKKEA
jgi:hypothetical protein